MQLKSSYPPIARFKWVTEGILFFAGFLTLYFLDWPQLRYWRVKGPGGRFEDLQSILAAGDCFGKIGNIVYQDDGGCTGYMYGRFLLQTFNFLHIHASDYKAIGFFFLILLSFGFAFLFKNIEFRFAILMKAAIIFSPPIVLLAERGNFDIFIFLLVIASALLIVSNFPVIASIPLMTASLIKFYTLPSLFAILILKFRMRTKLLLLSAAIFIGFLISQDLRRIQVGFRQFWYAQFGMSIWGRYANEVGVFNLNETTISILGFFIFVISILVISRITLIPKQVLVEDDSPFQVHSITFLLLFSSHLACFVLGMSYDYRLIFFIGATGALLTSRSLLAKEQIRKVLIMLLCLVWCSYNSGQLQILGNVILEVMTAWYVLIVYFHAKVHFQKVK